MARRTRIRISKHTIVAAFTGASLFGAVPAAAGDGTPGTTSLLGPAVQKLLIGEVEAVSFPEDPQAALEEAVEGFSDELGISLDAGPQIAASAIPRDVAARLAVLVDALHRCHQASSQILRDMPGDLLADVAREDGKGPPPEIEAVRAVRRCGVALQSAAKEARRFLESAPLPATVLDLWPVLLFDSRTEANLYAHDYALIVDVGGDDVYANNAGGNLLDVRRGPDGSLAPEKGDAIGCQKISPDAVEGDCVISSALLLDLSGDDTYGVLQPPDPDIGPDRNGDIVARGDARCTADPLIRRIVTQGAGLAGVGILIDSSGSDEYIAKTVSQGAGHVGGVGVLRDEGSGDDSYLAIRNSQGFALVWGVGILKDDGGNDIFDYYMPSPLDPTADFQTDGSGGVIDDTGVCDNLPRQLQGTALLTGIGIFIDSEGSDYFRGSAKNVQEFQPSIFFGHGSQGFGGLGGLGFFFDLSGTDTYFETVMATDEKPQHDAFVEKNGAHELPSAENTGEFLDVKDE